MLKETLSDRIAEQLETVIAEGGLPPCECLPAGRRHLCTSRQHDNLMRAVISGDPEAARQASILSPEEEIR